MSWQTTTVALVGIIVGVPEGIVVGRLIWRAFAVNLGVLPVPVVIGWVVAAVAAGTLLVANVLAIGPAVAAARSRPASLLRSERAWEKRVPEQDLNSRPADPAQSTTSGQVQLRDEFRSINCGQAAPPRPVESASVVATL